MVNAGNGACSATGIRGFTLIEVLVAVALIGIIAASAVLSLGVVSSDRHLARESERLKTTLDRTANTALFSGRRTGVLLSAGAYRPVQRRQGLWLPFPARHTLSGERRLGPGIRLSVADGRGGWNDQPGEVLAFDVDGLATAARLRLVDGQSRRASLITVSVIGDSAIAYASAAEDPR